MERHLDFTLALISKIEHSTPGSGLSPYLLLCQCVESNVFLYSKYAESELAAYKVDYLKESFQSDKLNKFNFDTFTVVKGTKTYGNRTKSAGKEYLVGDTDCNTWWKIRSILTD